MKPWLLFFALLGAINVAWADAIFTDDGRAVTRAEVIGALVRSDFILLGEQHDNPHHHRLRSELIGELVNALGNPIVIEKPADTAAKKPAQNPTLVMEYLDRGARLDPKQPLLEEMERAGFSVKGWQWPLHEPLFAVARAAGLNIVGGNLKRGDARRVAMEGDAAVEPVLADKLSRAPLSTSAKQSLDDALNEGHCGHMPASRLPNMRLAQRARDAAMATTMLEASSRPVILLAGNGHVRSDFGVTALLRDLAPKRNRISIGFYEADTHWERRLAELRGVFDYVWFTAPTQREDPCAGFKFPVSKS